MTSCFTSTTTSGILPSSPPFEIFPLEEGLTRHLHEKRNNRKSENFEIIYITEGSGVMKTNTDNHTIEKNMIYCFCPGQFREFHQLEKVRGYYLGVSAEFFNLAETNLRTSIFPCKDMIAGDPVRIIVSTDSLEELEETFTRMCKEYANYYSLRAEILMGFFQILLIYLSRIAILPTDTRPESRDVTLARIFFTMLRKDFITRKMVADYAKELSVTPNYLNLIVKKVTGYSVSHHIQQQIVMEAQRQARYSNRSMKEIAYSLGFEDMAHFSKFFKTNSGMNFSSYKKAAFA